VRRTRGRFSRPLVFKGNNVTGVTKPNGSTVTTVYDNAQRVTGSVEKTADGAVITGFAYTYDALGRIASETHQPENVRYTYTYDDLSRVTARTATDLSNNTQTQETYAYDAAGNLVSSGSNAFTYGTNNRLTAVSGQTVSYDADGNMTASPLGSFTYDSGNRLLSAGGHTYTYNAEDVRIRNQYTDADVTYVYDTNVKLNRMLTKTENGVTTKFVYGLGLIGEEVGSAFRTYHFDSRGSTVAITDQTGTVTDTFKYDTYGKLLSRTGTTAIIFGYNGRDGVVTDTNGLIYMRARYYSPELRRFVNADIIPGEISQAVTLNRYAYANGNPVSNVDPFGLAAEEERGWQRYTFAKNFFKIGNTLSVVGNFPLDEVYFNIYGTKFRFWWEFEASSGETDFLTLDLIEKQIGFISKMGKNAALQAEFKENNHSFGYSQTFEIDELSTATFTATFNLDYTVSAEYTMTTKQSENLFYRTTLGIESKWNKDDSLRSFPSLAAACACAYQEVTTGQTSQNYIEYPYQPLSEDIMKTAKIAGGAAATVATGYGIYRVGSAAAATLAPLVPKALEKLGQVNWQGISDSVTKGWLSFWSGSGIPRYDLP